MPIQINELVIRANIVEPGSEPVGGGGNTSPAKGDAANKEELIKECAALVMEIINSKNQR